MEVLAGLLLLLFLVILIRRTGNRLVPLIMPESRLKSIGVGFGGALIGSSIDRVPRKGGPEIWEVYLVASIVGCILVTIGYGLLPFVKIMIGRV